MTHTLGDDEVGRRIADMLASQTVLQTKQPDTLWSFRSSDAGRLSRDLRAYNRAFLVRCMLENLGYDEHSPFQWNLDHKLVQGSILHRLLGTRAPQVAGLVQLWSETNGQDLNVSASAKFTKGFVLKRARGYASDRAQVLQTGASRLVVTKASLDAYDGSLATEQVFLQERIDTVREYRVHTIGNDIIPSLTYRTYGSPALLGILERNVVNHFVAECIALLPPSLLANSICAWDLGVDRCETYSVFEINFSGQHPTFEPGFHCSNHLQDEHEGPLNMAKLLRHLVVKYGIHVQWDMQSRTNPLECEAAACLYQVSRWLRLLEIADEFFGLFNDMYNSTPFYSDTAGKEISIAARIYTNNADPIDRRYAYYVEWLKRMTDDLR